MHDLFEMVEKDLKIKHFLAVEMSSFVVLGILYN